MIKKEIIENDNEHIIIYLNEPIRVEIIGDFVLHGYKGTKIDTEQEPCIFHDTNYIE
jgi:hypothetical protein